MSTTPRIQAPQPLIGATPTLQPTARPVNTGIGATPPPRQSDLMQLANAFGAANSELRDLLRDVAASEEKDAAALGEIEATRLAAEGRIQELDSVLKKKVDSGELSFSRLPSAQRAAALRIGHQHAEVGFQTELRSRLEEAVRGGQPATDKIVAETFRKYAASFGQDQFYERMGFTQAAENVMSNFRQRALETQSAEFEKEAKQRIADEGTELAFQLATANVDTLPTAKGLVKTFLDNVRGKELPKAEVNAFFSENILKPAVARLVTEKNFTGATQLLEEIKTLDLTGKNGLYGKTEDGSKTLLELSSLVESRTRHAAELDAEALRNAVEKSGLTGLSEAAKDLYDIRAQNNGQLPASERFRVLEEARKRITDPLAFRRYTEVFNAEYESDERYRADPTATAKLLVEIDTLDPQRLEAKEAELNLRLGTREIPASAYHEAMMTIRRNKALYAQVQESDVTDFQRAVFAKRDVRTGGVTLDVGDDSLIEEWSGFNPQQQLAIRSASSDFFAEALRRQIRMLSQGNPEQVPAIKAQAWDKASTAAKEFARNEVTRVRLARLQKETEEKVKAQARAVREAQAKARLTDSLWTKPLDMTRNAQDFRYVPKLDFNDEKSREKIYAEFREQSRLPRAERDYGSVAFRAGGVYYMFPALRDNRTVHLPSLAEASKKDRESLEVYAAAKSALGFTPEEIKAGKTKHGVEFNPAEIDPKVISVFRSVAELNKHWNNGQFDETFGEIGDSVDPDDAMTPEEFYLAQLALLTTRK